MKKNLVKCFFMAAGILSLSGAVGMTPFPGASAGLTENDQRLDAYVSEMAEIPCAAALSVLAGALELTWERDLLDLIANRDIVVRDDLDINGGSDLELTKRRLVLCISGDVAGDLDLMKTLDDGGSIIFGSTKRVLNCDPSDELFSWFRSVVIETLIHKSMPFDYYEAVANEIGAAYAAVRRRTFFWII
ncbi:MAG: hypothetical protein LBJ45_00150 [Holosporaceae bacterium]|jgi:hypothetical protein|nr:hypothetical protein [Holosporaceae bacterium]